MYIICSQVVMREVSGGTSVLDFDQLNFLRQEGLIFKGFHEAAISFPPSSQPGNILYT